MKKLSNKFFFVALIAVLLTALLVVPSVVTAYDWWMVEVEYTLNDRTPDAVVGAHTRFFLPNVVATMSDGMKMDVNYQVIKDDAVLAEGKYTRGVYYDLNGEGVYTIVYQGEDAINSYSITVIADANKPSVVLDFAVSSEAYTDEAFKVPGGKIFYQGQEYVAEVVLEMANGNRYAAQDKVIPEAGRMTIYYQVLVDGKNISFTYDVYVYDRTLGFYDDAGKFYPAAVQAYPGQDLYGAVLNSNTNFIYTYSEVLDLSKSTKETPIIVLNNASTESRYNVPKIRIVDIYDPQNYIEVVFRYNSDTNKAVYVVAKAPGQELVGHKRGTELYFGTVFGTNVTFPTHFDADKGSPAKIYYDAEENALFGEWYGSIDPISDFDADYQSKPWAGFTTGEVYIQVIQYAAIGHLCVQEVGGQSLASWGKDDAAPTLSVNMGNYITAPNAIVGSAYPVFTADACDLQDGPVPVSIRVFKGYNAVNGMEVNIRNGVFVPYEAGYYTIVYSANDNYGNTTVKKINVLALENGEYTPISATVPVLPKNAYVGEMLALPAPASITGGHGEVSYYIEITKPDGTKMQITDDYVIIPAEGKNTISYVFTDYLGVTKTYSQEINCTISANPILYEITMPDMLMSGKEFQLPEALYAQGSTPEIIITATLDGKEIPVVNNVIVPVAQKSLEKLVVTYTAKTDTGTSSKSYSIDVLNGSTSDRTSYFYTASGSFTKSQKSDSIKFTTKVSGSTLKFINPVLASKLQLIMTVDSKQNDADKLSILLSDSLDPSISIRIDIVKKVGGNSSSTSEVYVNGVYANDMVGNFYGSSEALKLAYYPVSATLVDALGNTVATMNRTVDGRIFEGFPSGQVNIAFSAGTVGSNGFAFNILQINNQTFYDDDLYFDNYAELELTGDLDLQAELGSVLNIPAAFGADVFSPNVTVTVTVKVGSEVLLNKVPADKVNSVTLEKYGTYYVTYTHDDGVNAPRSASYRVRTVEHEAPHVELSKMPKTAKVGDKVTVKLPVATDGHDTSVSISVIIKEPNNNMILLKGDDMRFTARYEGTYTVMFYVYDECFNYQIVEHTIVVTAK